MVKPGYKQTEVGVIPDDWDVCELGKVLKSNPKYGINAPAVEHSDSLPTYIRITDISEDGRYSQAEKVSVKHPTSSDYLLKEGDIVFARTGASVGKSYLYNPVDGPLVFAGFLIRIQTESMKLLPVFLFHYIRGASYWRWVREMSMRSGQPGINGKEYTVLPIPVPKILEQEAIANALSDVDALIESLERLIAKKRDIKRAAMQELLYCFYSLPG